MPRSESKKYDLISITLHWLTGILVVITFILGPEEFGHMARDGVDPADRVGVVWHESLGILIFTITTLRFFWVAVRPSPPMHSMTLMIRRMSQLGHFALWALLFTLPISAVLTLMSENYPLTLLGNVRIDDWSSLVPSMLLNIVDWGDVHEFLGQAIVWFAGLHAVAALIHHFKFKDQVLKSMLP